MKIDSSVKPTSTVNTGETRARPAGEGGPPPSRAPTGEQVQLSSLSSGLQQAESAINATPAVNQVRVDEIKQAISEGRFEVNPEKVADGLIESVRQMLDAQPRPA